MFKGAAALMQVVGLVGIGNIPGAVVAVVTAAPAFSGTNARPAARTHSKRYVGSKMVPCSEA